VLKKKKKKNGKKAKDSLQRMQTGAQLCCVEQSGAR
jgi:hypothetical protein